MTHPTMFLYFTRDEIAIDKQSGQPVKVTAMKRVNVEWTDQNGKTWRGKPGCLEKAPAGTEFNLRVPSAAPTEFPFGTVVRFRPDTNGWAKEHDTLFVVLKGQDYKHQLAWLNGHPTQKGMRYSGVHGSSLEKVTAGEI